MAYRAIGKTVVKYGLQLARRRYGRQLSIGAGLVGVAVGTAIYLANREVPEG